jgi:hypothetical protein
LAADASSSSDKILLQEWSLPRDGWESVERLIWAKGHVLFNAFFFTPHYYGSEDRKYHRCLEAVPNRLRESRNRFENARDIGLLGKATTRPFFAVYQYGLCEASLLVIGIGQPVLSAAKNVSDFFNQRVRFRSTGSRLHCLDADSLTQANLRTSFQWFPVISNVLDVTFMECLLLS